MAKRALTPPQLISIDELSDYLGVPVKTIVALVRRAPRVQAIALLTFSVVINAHAGMDPIRELVRAGDGCGGSERGGGLDSQRRTSA